MEATKHMRAYEDFDNGTDPNESEKSQQETIAKIWEVIDSGDFFSIISAYVSGNAADVLEEEHRELMKDVLKMKNGYLEQCYKYQYSDGNGLTSVKRKSLFVPAMGYHELLALGKKWKQETVAFGGNGGISVVRVSDQKVLLDMTTESMKLAWNFLLTNQRNIPW